MQPHLLYVTCLISFGASFGAGLLVFPAADRPSLEPATNIAATNMARAAASTGEVSPDPAWTVEQTSPERRPPAALSLQPVRPEGLTTPVQETHVPPQAKPIVVAQPVASTAIKAQARAPVKEPPARKKPARREFATRRDEATRAMRRFGDGLQDIPANSYAADARRRGIVIRPTSIQDVLLLLRDPIGRSSQSSRCGLADVIGWVHLRGRTLGEPGWSDVVRRKEVAAMSRKILLVAGLAALVTATCPPTAQAQFYKGKTITMIVNYPPGGPTDIEGRIVAQHLPAHIPGKPTIIVKNVGGAGGIIGSNQLGEAAPSGETIGFFTLDMIAPLVGNPAVRTGYSDFVTIAGVENPLVVYMRKDTPPGVRIATDIMKVAEFKALSLNAQNSNTIHQSLCLDLLGVKYQAVPAYRGLKEVETAILQNIGQLANTSLPGWRGSIETSMGDIVLPLWQLSARGKDGGYPRSAALPDLPTFEEFHATVHGRKPSGQLYEVLRASTDPLVAMFRTALLPPRTSAEAVSVMRSAFVELWKDPQFIRDYSNVIKSQPLFVSGNDAQDILAALGKIKPEIKAFLADYVNRLVK